MDRKQITASIAGAALVTASLFAAVAAAQGSGEVVGDSPSSPPAVAVEAVPVTVMVAEASADQPPTDTPDIVTYESAEYTAAAEYEEEEHEEYDNEEEHEDEHEDYEDEREDYEDEREDYEDEREEYDEDEDDGEYEDDD